MTQEQIAAARAVTQAATQGPWQAGGQHAGDDHVYGPDEFDPTGPDDPTPGGILARCVDEARYGYDRQANGRYIAASRDTSTGWGAALDALETAQKNEQADGGCIDHWSGRAIEAEARAEVAETEVARLTHTLNEQGMEPDTVGHLVVDTVAYATGNDAWHDEWLDFYTPANWLGSHRGAAAFLASKIRALAADNASLLRRVESLRMAVWGENHGEKAP